MSTSSEPNPTELQREQTDESLRVERERTDLVLDDTVGAIDELADEVINTARRRADELLAAARAKTDRQAGRVQARVADQVAQTRSKEDRLLSEERADADDALRAERAEQVVLLSEERSATDEDLISERKRADDALTTRDAFLGIVSHDLRNMLAGVVGYATLIAKEAGGENRATQIIPHTEAIRRAGARMSRLMGDLIDVAMIDASRLSVNSEPGDPALVVTEAVDAFQAQAVAGQFSLVAKIEPPIPIVHFDSARILQVLTNLVTNAIKFTPVNGRITVRLYRAGDEVQISVTDTGSGMPESQLEAVFTRFVQVDKNRGGNGLGLYISKAIVQGHGGRIWAESKLGAGSTFCFTLPIS